jgi:hypothetical protein
MAELTPRLCYVPSRSSRLRRRRGPAGLAGRARPNSCRCARWTVPRHPPSRDLGHTVRRGASGTSSRPGPVRGEEPQMTAIARPATHFPQKEPHQQRQKAVTGAGREDPDACDRHEDKDGYSPSPQDLHGSHAPLVRRPLCGPSSLMGARFATVLGDGHTFGPARALREVPPVLCLTGDQKSTLNRLGRVITRCSGLVELTSTMMRGSFGICR